MDFSNREVQSHTAAPSAQIPAAGHQNQGPGNIKQVKHDADEKSQWFRIVTVILVAALVILLCAVIALINSSNNQAKNATKAAALSTESQYVQASKLQAVFLNTGQVYFGHIKTLNSKYLVVTNIYYLQSANSTDSSSKSTANSNVSLVKLGCELHEPLDQMVINRDQVTFWENLGDNGQVAKAVTAFQKQNPNGQKCVDQSTSSSSTSNSAQPANSNAKP